MYYITNIVILTALAQLKAILENAEQDVRTFDAKDQYTDRGLVTENYKIVHTGVPCSYTTFRTTCAKMRMDPFIVYTDMNLTAVDERQPIVTGLWVELYPSELTGGRFLDNNGYSPAMLTVDQTISLGTVPGDLNPKTHRVSLDKTSSGAYEYIYTKTTELRNGLCLSEMRFPNRPSDVQLIMEYKLTIGDWLNEHLLKMESVTKDTQTLLDLMPKFSTATDLTALGVKAVYDQNSLIDVKNKRMEKDLVNIIAKMKNLKKEGDLYGISAKMASLNVIIAEHIDYIRTPLTQSTSPLSNLQPNDKVDLYKNEDGTLTGILDRSNRTKYSLDSRARLVNDTEIRHLVGLLVNETIHTSPTPTTSRPDITSTGPETDVGGDGWLSWMINTWNDPAQGKTPMYPGVTKPPGVTISMDDDNWSADEDPWHRRFYNAREFFTVTLFDILVATTCWPTLLYIVVLLCLARRDRTTSDRSSPEAPMVPPRVRRIVVPGLLSENQIVIQEPILRPACRNPRDRIARVVLEMPNPPRFVPTSLTPNPEQVMRGRYAVRYTPTYLADSDLSD